MTVLRLYPRLVLSCFFHLISTTSGLPIYKLSPAWKTEISKQASNYAQHVALPFLMKQLDELHVAGMIGVAKTPLGKVKYDLENVKISDVDIKKVNISLNSDRGISMNANDASFLVGADWKYNEKAWPHISDAGSCKLTVADLSLRLLFDIDKGKNISSPPMMRVKDCSLKIGKFQIKFSGGASWLYNLFSSTISQDIKSKLQSHICTSVKKLIDAQANKVLATLPEIVKTLKTIT